MTAQPRAIIVEPGAGQVLDFGPTGVSSVMLSGEQTGGTLAVILNTEVGEGGPPPHVHANEDELFLVVDGHYSFFAEGHWTDVGAGGVVYLPRGTVHTYRNTVIASWHSNTGGQGARHAPSARSPHLSAHASAPAPSPRPDY